jgi:hypothetical protein
MNVVNGGEDVEKIVPFLTGACDPLERRGYFNRFMRHKEKHTVILLLRLLYPRSNIQTVRYMSVEARSFGTI